MTRLNIKKLTSLHYCIRATKSHIQYSRNHFTRTQSDKTTNWLRRYSRKCVLQRLAKKQKKDRKKK